MRSFSHHTIISTEACSVRKCVPCLQSELRRLEGIEHAEHELNMLQQAHAIATAQQEMARLAAADQREAIARHEHRLQQMHDAQASTHTKQQWPIPRAGFSYLH